MSRWDELSKKQKKHIREMAGVAYEREMTSALDKLLETFQKWKKGELNPFDVNEAIHEFHNGISRDLYKQYAIGGDQPDMAVVIALAHGVLKIEELNEGCRAFYQERVKSFLE
jgi:hypothetical protein